MFPQALFGIAHLLAQYFGAILQKSVVGKYFVAHVGRYIAVFSALCLYVFCPLPCPSPTRRGVRFWMICIGQGGFWAPGNSLSIRMLEGCHGVLVNRAFPGSVCPQARARRASRRRRAKALVNRPFPRRLPANPRLSGAIANSLNVRYGVAALCRTSYFCRTSYYLYCLWLAALYRKPI